MPPKKKQSRAEAQPGVDVRPPKVVRYEDGVPVRTHDVPAQTAGADNGHSAGTKKEND